MLVLSCIFFFSCISIPNFYIIVIYLDCKETDILWNYSGMDRTHSVFKLVFVLFYMSWISVQLNLKHDIWWSRTGEIKTTIFMAFSESEEMSFNSDPANVSFGFSTRSQFHGFVNTVWNKSGMTLKCCVQQIRIKPIVAWCRVFLLIWKVFRDACGFRVEQNFIQRGNAVEREGKENEGCFMNFHQVSPSIT